MTIFVKENYRLGDGKCLLFLSRVDLRNFNGRTSTLPPSPFLSATSRPIFRNLASYPPQPTSLSPKTCLLFLQNLRAFARQAAGLGEKSPGLSDNEVRDWGDKVRSLGNGVPRGHKKTVGRCLSVYAKLKLNVRWNNGYKYNTFRKECQEVGEFILERNEKNSRGITERGHIPMHPLSIFAINYSLQYYLSYLVILLNDSVAATLPVALPVKVISFTFTPV